MTPSHALGVALALGAAVAACASTSAPEPASLAYLADAGYRRATLVASLVNPDNEYSRLRLASYESGGARDWSRLPEWNPRVSVVASAELDRQGGARADAPLGADARALDLVAASRGDDAALLALGADAFFRYPVELSSAAELALASRDALTRYGFWSDAARGAGGLVRAEVADGSRRLAFTCATCHATPRDGALVIGLGNDALDLGKLAIDASPATADAALVARWGAWGPGRIDVTTSDAVEPVRFADLRPVRWLTHLQADASVAQTNRDALAIRLETLLVTSHDMAVRPPRVVALALAMYVRSLADALPPGRLQGASASRGEALFVANCARCHAPPSFTGPPVPLEVVGTDPSLGRSPVRGTGTYRVPSLHGVAARGALLHDASLTSVAELLDPARLAPGFGGGRRHDGAVPGHAFGLELSADDRAALAAFVSGL